MGNVLIVELCLISCVTILYAEELCCSRSVVLKTARFGGEALLCLARGDTLCGVKLLG